MFKILPILSFFILSAQNSNAETTLRVAENSCNGYPRVKNYENFQDGKCLGLVLDSRDVPWEKPRRILLNSEENKVYVTDMGGWDNRNSGALWEVDLQTKNYKKIYEGGDWTHGLQVDNQGRLLVGNTNKIIRQTERNNWQTLIENLPSEGSHPLSHFIILKNNDLILNIGAPSNDCSREFRGTHCAQRDVEGEIRHYTYKSQTDDYNLDYKVLARGLRNSMALLFNENTNTLYQAENNIDKFGVPEEFNLIPFGRDTLDFGWPFCFAMNEEYVFPNFSGIRPGSFSSFCSRVAQTPLFLIPPHSAPLDMIYYTKNATDSNEIVMGWHGHRRSQNYALVSYGLNSMNEPVYSGNGLNSFTPLLSGVGDTEKDLLRPVGLHSDKNGNIWIVDDIQKRVFIYANSNSLAQDDDSGADNSFELLVEEHISKISSVSWEEFEQLYDRFYTNQSCTECHGPNEIPQNPRTAYKTFLNRGWLDLSGQPEQMLLFKRTSIDADKAMPPAPEEPFEASEPELYESLLNWVSKVR